MALKSINIPTRNNQIGSNIIPAQTVPAGVTSASFSFDTANWTNSSSRLVIALEVSYDNQATWVGGGSSDMQSRPDGTFRDRTGAIMPTVTATFTWANGATHVRGSYTVEGASIQTGGSVDLN